MEIKIGDSVRLKSKHHQGKVFDVVFIDGDKVTCYYSKGNKRGHYRVILGKDRIESIER